MFVCVWRRLPLGLLRSFAHPLLAVALDFHREGRGDDHDDEEEEEDEDEDEDAEAGRAALQLLCKEASLLGFSDVLLACGPWALRRLGDALQEEVLRGDLEVAVCDLRTFVTPELRAPELSLLAPQRGLHAL